MKPWPLVNTKTILDARVFTVTQDRTLSPRTGLECDFYVLHTPDWVNIVPITAEGELVLVRQYRQGIREATLEIPGGTMDPQDGSPEEAARRELLEETGYAAERLRLLGWVHPNPALQNTRCHTFLAEDARLVAPQSPDDSEDLEVLRISPGEAAERVRRGEITHALVLCALVWAFGLQPPALRP